MAHTRKAQNDIVIKCIEVMYYDDLMQYYFYIIIYISIYCISVSWLTLFSSDTEYIYKFSI